MELLNVTFASILAIVANNADLATDNPDQATKPKYEQVAKVSTYILPNISGAWRLDLPETDPKQPACQEIYKFDRDDQMTGTSGQEFSYGKYAYAPTDGLPALAIRTIYDNNAPDCSGKQIDQSGETLMAFVKLSKDERQMQWCGDPEGKKCDMTLHRILP